MKCLITTVLVRLQSLRIKSCTWLSLQQDNNFVTVKTQQTNDKYDFGIASFTNFNAMDLYNRAAFYFQPAIYFGVLHCCVLYLPKFQQFFTMKPWQTDNGNEKACPAQF